MFKQMLMYHSDYKDNGTNILLDANENAIGPGLALDRDGNLSNATVNGSSSAPAVEIDLLGLNRYPDPYATMISIFPHVETDI
jgi:histidinol-phosphate aminotransferase